MEFAGSGDSPDTHTYRGDFESLNCSVTLLLPLTLFRFAIELRVMQEYNQFAPLKGTLPVHRFVMNSKRRLVRVAFRCGLFFFAMWYGLIACQATILLTPVLSSSSSAAHKCGCREGSCSIVCCCAKPDESEDRELPALANCDQSQPAMVFQKPFAPHIPVAAITSTFCGMPNSRYRGQNQPGFWTDLEPMDKIPIL